MKYNCDMIADLLPLYIDDVCSPASREAIEEHLSECPPCRKLCEDMRRCDTVIDADIAKERDEVLVKQAKFFKRRSAIAGAVIGAIFAIPILICLIVNLATGAGLTWFFIVLAAMFIPTSLIVVPLMAPDDKAFWSVTSFTASHIALLGVCCLYSGGSWFLTAAPAVLFGLSIPFMPIVATSKTVSKHLGCHKALTVIGTYTLTYALMMLSIGIRHGSAHFFRVALAYSMPPLIFMWAMFLLIRLPKWNGLFKTASCILAAALVFFFNDTIVLMIYNRASHIPKFRFSFATYEMANDTLCWAVLIGGIVVSALFAAAGLIKSGSGRKKEDK